MNTSSTKFDVVDFDPDAFGRHLAQDVNLSGNVEAQVRFCASVEDGLRFIWRCQGVPPAEIEARTVSWCEAFRVQLGRQSEASIEAIKAAPGSTKH